MTPLSEDGFAAPRSGIPGERADVLWELSKVQAHALACLDSPSSIDGYGGEGVVTTGATGLYDGQAFVHWRTANALTAMGLVAVTHEYDYTAIRRTER